MSRDEDSKGSEQKLVETICDEKIKTLSSEDDKYLAGYIEKLEEDKLLSWLGQEKPYLDKEFTVLKEFTDPTENLTTRLIHHLFQKKASLTQIAIINRLSRESLLMTFQWDDERRCTVKALLFEHVKDYNVLNALIAKPTISEEDAGILFFRSVKTHSFSLCRHIRRL